MSNGNVVLTHPNIHDGWFHEENPQWPGQAMSLRVRGIAADVSPNSQKFGKQIRNADRRGIPFVWFTAEDGEQVRDIRSGEQVPADPDVWEPPAADLRPAVVSSDE